MGLQVISTCLVCTGFKKIKIAFPKNLGGAFILQTPSNAFILFPKSGKEHK